MWQGVKHGVWVALFSAVLLFSVTGTTNAQVSLTTQDGGARRRSDIPDPGAFELERDPFLVQPWICGSG